MDWLPTGGTEAGAVTLAYLTSRFTLRREKRGRAVAGRRTAVLDVQQPVVALRVARRRYGDATKVLVSTLRPGSETSTAPPARGTDEERSVFEAESAYDATLARLDSKEPALTSAAVSWTEKSHTMMLSSEVSHSEEAGLRR